MTKAQAENGPIGLGPTRARVLSHLLASPEPLSAATVSECLGVHANTARFHLDALVEEGLADRGTERRSVQGRPRVLYNPTQDAALQSADGYRDLAQALVRQLVQAAPEPMNAARAAGRTWGDELADEATDTIDERSPLELLVGAVNRIGFTSRLAEAEGEPVIEITRCPYALAAKSERAVCAIHQGVLQGFLDRLDSGYTVTRLEPWVEPNLCRAHLSA